MSRKKAKNDPYQHELPATRLVASVGISLLAMRYRLAELDPNDWYGKWQEIVEELEIYSSLLAALVDGNEAILDEITVALPKNIGARTVPNPFYEEKRKRPSDEQEGRDQSSLGDIPF